MNTTDIGFEKFEEDFYADLNTMYIKPKDEDLEKYTQVIKSSINREQREEFLKRKEPYAKVAWERYVEKLNELNQSE